MILPKQSLSVIRFIFCCFVLFLLFYNSAHSARMDQIAIQLKWFHQYQFAGYYAAKEKGFYSEEGLDVTLYERDPTTAYIQDVINDKAQYGVADAGLLLSRLQGQPVVLLEQIYQHSPLVFITRKDSGIRTPYDLPGKKVMFDIEGQGDAPLNAMLINTLTNPDKVKIQQTTFRNTDLFENKIDAYSAYISSQSYAHQKRNEAINIIDPRDYGIDFYGDNFFTTEREIKQHPERVKRVIRATMKGWNYALNHSDEVIDIILDHYNTQNLTREHLEYEAKAIKNMIIADFVTLGHYEKSRFQKIAETYARLEATTNSQVDDGFFYISYENDLTLTQQERDYLNSIEALKVPLLNSQPPLSFVENDQARGYLNELFEKVAQKLDLSYTRIKNLTYSESLQALKNNNVDLLNDYSSHVNADTYALETSPVLTIPFVAVGRTDDMTRVRTINDLKDKKLVLVEGFQQTRRIQNQYPQLSFILVKRIDEAYRVLRSRDADFYIDNATHAGFYLRDRMISDLRIMGALPVEEMGRLELRFAIQKDKPLLHSAIEKALTSIDRQELQSMRDKWIFYQTTEKSIMLTEEEKIWLAENPVIEIGVMNAWPPFSFVDEQNRIQGINVKLIQALNKRLGGALVAVSGKWTELYDAVKNRKLDGLMDITHKESRESDFNFTRPYLSIPHIIVAQKGSQYLNNENDLVGKTIGLEVGFGNIEYFSKNYPGVHIKEYPNTALALDAVSRSEVDAYVGNRAVATYLIRKEVMLDLEVQGRLKKEGSVLSIGLRKDQPILRTILQKSLDTISEEERNAIIKPWSDLTQEFNSLWHKLSLEERNWIKQNPLVTLCIDNNLPPYAYANVAGKAEGLVVDLIQSISKKAGIAIHLKPMEFSDIAKGPCSDDIHGTSFVPIASTNYPERYQTIQGPINNLDALFTFSPEKFIAKTLDKVRDKRLIIYEGVDPVKFGLPPGNEYIEIRDIKKAFEMLVNGQADGYLEDYSYVKWHTRRYFIDDLTALFLTNNNSKPLFSIDKKYPLLSSILEKSLLEVSDQIPGLINKWHAVLPGSEKKTLLLTDQEKQWLKEHPVIRVVLDPDWAPVEYRDENGQYKGMSLDYLDFLEKTLGIEFFIVEGLSWKESVAAVKNKDADMFASVSRTPQRETYLEFTKPYVHMPIRIFARDNVSYIGSVDNLAGKKVALVEGYAIHDWFKYHHPDISLVTVEAPAQGLEMLSNGDVDVFVGNMVTANYYLGKQGITNVRLSGETPYYNSQAMAVRNDWPIFATILQKALETISDQEHNLIFNRWMSLKFEDRINYTLIWQVTFLALFLLFIFFYWNIKLAREVRFRKQAEQEIKEYHLQLENIVDERTHDLKDSEAKVVQILESTAEGILRVNRKGQITLANTAARQFLGYQSDEIIGCDLKKIIFSPTSAYVKSEVEIPMLQSLKDGMPSYIDDALLWKKNGSSFPVEYSCMPIIKEMDTIGMVVSFSDISERKEAEDQLLLEQQRTEDIITGTNAGTWDWNLKTDEMIVNERWANIIGYTLDELSPVDIKTWNNSLHPEDYKDVKAALEKHFSGQLDYYDIEFRQLHKDGHWVWINACGKVVEWTQDNKPLRMSGTHLDITDRKQAEEELVYQAHFDSLTHLPNRFLALDRLSQHILEADRIHKKVGVLFMDLDDFKKINDTLGHDAGDNILVEAAKRLTLEVREVDTVGRLGGDEFVVIIGLLEDACAVQPIAEKILESFRNSFELDGRELIMTASIGIAMYPDDGDNASELLRNADSAMYYSKEHGRNTYSYFTDSMNQQVSRRLLIEEQMHGALARKEFWLCYQPKVDITTRKIIGVEALLRWKNPALGFVSPDEFIPIAEQTGLIVSIGLFVLEEAMQVAASWQSKYKQDLSMAINLSPRQFRDPDLVSNIESTMQKSGLSSNQLELEITEGVLLTGHAYVDNALEALSGLGISLAMDDFGTGYSSLSYLRSYPFDVLKIDRSFIDDITEDAADLELVNAAIAMSHGLGLKVVAEGVETEAQLSLLSQQHCDIAQGYLFSKPLLLDELESLLEKEKL